jgi:hypothetical protein
LVASSVAAAERPVIQRRQRRDLVQVASIKWVASTAQNAKSLKGCAVPYHVCAAPSFRGADRVIFGA